MLNSFVNHGLSLTRQTLFMPAEPITIGDRIRTLRKSKGLNLAPVAKAVGISISALSQIETGITRAPTPDTLFRIADALDVEARYLVFGHNQRSVASLSAMSLTDTGRFRLRNIKKSQILFKHA